MQFHEKISFITQKLSNANNNDFKFLFKYYIKKILLFIGKISEIRDTYADYSGLYQIHLANREFNFNFKIDEKNILYQEGLCNDYDIRFIITKKVLLKIFKMELHPYDAYMRGLIKADGNLSYTLRFWNFLKLCIKYLSDYY